MSGAAFVEETRRDYRRVSRAMADAHRLWHDAGGWTDCELDPCHSVGVLLGDVAVLIMGQTPPKDAA